MRRRFVFRSGLAVATTLVATLVVVTFAIGVGPAAPRPTGVPPTGALLAPGSVPVPVAQGGGGPIPWANPGAGTAGWRVAFEWHVPVLMYHLISTPAQAGRAIPSLVVSPTLFREQLQAAWLAGWRTITAAQLAADMAAGTEPPPHTFVITIDDGSVDGWTQAFPILRAFRFVATYYVPSARIGRPGDLSVADVIALSRAGMEIANHTVDHVPLAYVAPAEARFQIGDAQAAIAALLGAPPTTMAYPFGSRDPEVIADAGAAGIALAFTTADGCSESLAARLDEPRLRVSPTTTPASLVAELGRCGAMPSWG